MSGIAEVAFRVATVPTSQMAQHAICFEFQTLRIFCFLSSVSYSVNGIWIISRFQFHQYCDAFEGAEGKKNNEFQTIKRAKSYATTHTLAGVLSLFSFASLAHLLAKLRCAKYALPGYLKIASFRKQPISIAWSVTT